MKFHFKFNFHSIKQLGCVFTLFLFWATNNIVSAQQKIFSPSLEDPALTKAISASVLKNYQSQIANLPSENKKDFITILKKRRDYIQEKIDNKEIYTNPNAQKYLDALISEIVKANPLLQSKDFKCYFSRSGIPNAEYLGEGLIFLNMGLFSRLGNESQVAFILCHELSHFYLNHSEKNIQKYVTAINSDEYQSQLKNIKKIEFGKRQELEKLMKGFTFDSRRHGRDHENNADSMAIEFLRNTRFDIRESLTTLALLDSIDTHTLQTDVALKKIFNFKDYPFQKRWIAKEEGLLGGHAKLKEDESISDSLKTHPDCKLRIKLLEPMVIKYRADNSLKNPVNYTEFQELLKTFRYEIIEYAFESNNYTKSLQYTIEELQNNLSDPYLITQVGKIFNGFYSAQKNHTLGKVSELPAPFFPPDYNLLLQFIQNLFLEDYASLSYHFLKQHASEMGNYEPFKSVYNTSIQNQQ